MCSSSPLPGHWSNLRCTTSVWSIVAYIFHHFLFNLSTRFSAVCEGQLEQLLIDIMVWHWHYDMSFDYFCLWSISRCSPSYLHICFPLLTIYSGIIDATLILLPELHLLLFRRCTLETYWMNWSKSHHSKSFWLSSGKFISTLFFSHLCLVLIDGTHMYLQCLWAILI